MQLPQSEAHGEIKPFHGNTGRLVRRTPLREVRAFFPPLEGRDAALILNPNLVT